MMKLKQKGMSLFEVMIALTLLSFMMAGVLTMSEDSRQTRDRTIALDQSNLGVERVFQILEWDFSHIYSPLYFSKFYTLKEKDERDQFDAVQSSAQLSRYQNNSKFTAMSEDTLPIPRFYEPDRNSIEFFTRSHRRKYQDSRESNFSWVRYAPADREVNDDEGEKKQVLGLVRYQTAVDPWISEEIDFTSLKGQTLLLGLTKFGIRFWDPRSKTFKDTLSEIKDGENIIHAIEVTIEWIDGLKAKRKEVRILRHNWPKIKLETSKEIKALQDKHYPKKTNATNSAASGASSSATNTSGSSTSSSGAQQGEGENGENGGNEEGGEF